MFIFLYVVFLKNTFIISHFYFIYLFLPALDLQCCARAFSSCSEVGRLLFVAVCGLLIVVVSLLAEHRLLGTQASVAVAHRLSCFMARENFPEQGLNPCPQN